jgi:hypothetical protein
MPSAEAVISSPGLRHFGGSKRAPAQVGVPVDHISRYPCGEGRDVGNLSKD